MKKKSARVEPRRAPVTPAGRAIVEAILDATERLLVERGFDGLTTNGIAELSGVSVGSFYQYFPTKEAAVGALGRRAREAQRDLVDRIVEANRDRPPAEVVRAIVTELARAHRERGAEQRALLREVPASWLDGAPGPESWTKAHALFAAKGDAGSDRPRLMTFLALQGALSAIEAALLQRPERLADEAFIDEVVLLVQRYART